MSVSEDNQNWPPKPSEGEPLDRPGNLAMVSPVPLGIASCVLILGLFGANIIFLFYFHQLSLQQKINFAIFHSDRSGILEGAAIVGVPVALLLGLLSWRILVGKAGLLLTASFLFVAVYMHLFGLPTAFVIGSGK